MKLLRAETKKLNVLFIALLLLNLGGCATDESRLSEDDNSRLRSLADDANHQISTVVPRIKVAEEEEGACFHFMEKLWQVEYFLKETVLATTKNGGSTERSDRAAHLLDSLESIKDDCLRPSEGDFTALKDLMLDFFKSVSSMNS